MRRRANSDIPGFLCHIVRRSNNRDAGLEVLIHIHTVVENSDHNDLGFGAGSVKDNMTTLAELVVAWLYFTRVAAYFGLASKQFEGIIKLLKVFIALTLSPPFGSKAAYIDNVFSGGSGEQAWTHQ